MQKPGEGVRSIEVRDDGSSAAGTEGIKSSTREALDGALSEKKRILDATFHEAVEFRGQLTSEAFLERFINRLLDCLDLSDLPETLKSILSLTIFMGISNMKAIRILKNTLSRRTFISEEERQLVETIFSEYSRKACKSMMHEFFEGKNPKKIGLKINGNIVSVEYDGNGVYYETAEYSEGSNQGNLSSKRTEIAERLRKGNEVQQHHHDKHPKKARGERDEMVQGCINMLKGKIHPKYKIGETKDEFRLVTGKKLEDIIDSRISENFLAEYDEGEKELAVITLALILAKEDIVLSPELLEMCKSKLGVLIKNENILKAVATDLLNEELNEVSALVEAQPEVVNELETRQFEKAARNGEEIVPEEMRAIDFKKERGKKKRERKTAEKADRTNGLFKEFDQKMKLEKKNKLTLKDAEDLSILYLKLLESLDSERDVGLEKRFQEREKRFMEFLFRMIDGFLEGGWDNKPIIDLNSANVIMNNLVPICSKDVKLMARLSKYRRTPPFDTDD